MRELTCGQFGGRVDRSACFGNDQLGQFQLGELLHDILYQFVGFAAGSAVTDGNQAHAVLFGEGGEGRHAAGPVAARLVRVDGVGVEQFAGGIDNGELATGTDTGVDAHGDVLTGGCRQQQVLEVLAKNADRFVFGAFA